MIQNYFLKKYWNFFQAYSLYITLENVFYFKKKNIQSKQQTGCCSWLDQE